MANDTIEKYDLPSTGQLKQMDVADLTKVSYDELLQMGIDANELKGYSQWILGKLADRVTNPPVGKLNEEGEETVEGFKPKKGALKEYAASIHVAYNSLMQYASIYRKYIAEDPNFHPFKFHGAVSWGVLALIASKSDTPAALLETLLDKGEAKSIEATAMYLKEHAEELPVTTGATAQQGEVETIPAKPNIRLEWESERKLYRVVIDPEDFPKLDFSAIKADLMEWLEGLS